jgi:hypothetical protein
MSEPKVTPTDPTLRSVLDAHNYADGFECCNCGHGVNWSYSDWLAHREQAVQTFLDAARDQRIAVLEKALDETTRMLAYLWDAENHHGIAVNETFYDDDPLNEDVPKCIEAARAALAAAPPEAAE